MAIFSEGGLTSPDCPIGIFCICLAVLCTVLNSLVFLHNYHKNKSVARSLYLCLSATDLVTAWVILVPYSVMVLKEEKDVIKCVEESSCSNLDKSDDELNEDVNLSDKILSVMSQLMILAPSHLTAFLAITRYIQIKYPLRPLRIKMVLAALSTSLIWAPTVVTCYFFSTKDLGISDKQYAVIGSSSGPKLFSFEFTWQMFPTIIFFPTLILQFLAIGSSLLTIYELVKSYLTPIGEAPRRRNTKSTVRILVTNIGSVFSLLCYTIVVTGDYESKNANDETYDFGDGDQIRLLVGVQLMPALVSALNPITYIAFAHGCSLRLRLRPE